MKAKALSTGAAALVAAFLLTACIPPAPAPFTQGVGQSIVVYGDSLVWQSHSLVEAQLKASYPGWTIVVRSQGGTAQCDWHHRMQEDAKHLNPAIVVVAFYGNHITPCAKSRPLPGLYRQDAEWAAAFWKQRGTRFAAVAAPPGIGQTVNPVAEAYRAAAHAKGFILVDSTGLYTTDGVATQTSRCGTGETQPRGCTNNRIHVRHSDGIHFPLAKGGHDAGGQRYADAINTAARVAGWKTPQFRYPRETLEHPVVYNP